jgi:anti-sigma-K factor RskA
VRSASRGNPAPDRAARESSRGFTILASAVVAAVVAIAVNYALFTSRTGSTPSDTSNDLGAITARLIEVQRNVDTTGDQLAGLQAKVAQITDLTLASLGPDSRVARLVGLPAAPSATGTVALSHSEGAAMLEVNGLPPTPDDKEYEVWWIGEKQRPLRAGMFEPLSQGATIVALDLPPPAEIVLGSTITLEQRGGADQPSGAIYLKGDFPRR